MLRVACVDVGVGAVRCVLCVVCAVCCVCCEWHNMCAASAKLLPDIQVTDGSDGKAKEISSQTNQPLFMRC